jgi:hypothetical protein
MPANFTIPPDTRAVGSGNPPADMNGVADTLAAMGATYNILNAAYSGGADPTGVADSTTAIQACINAANAAGGVVNIPPGIYAVSQLTILTGTVIRGSASGSYPGENAIPGVSVLRRINTTNLDVLLAPDGNNHFRIFDLAIDGNKANNTSGYGLKIADGAAGQECQAVIERCFFHDSPFSNIYLGKNRRGAKVLNGIFNYSGVDGITVASSDNAIQRNICGSNGRAGICLGTTITQNWAASSPSNAAAVNHVADNDIYQNQVGIALAASAWGNMIAFNGIDRQTLQGITVYDNASNSLLGNSFHSNGTATTNTYGHIDIAAGVVQVDITGSAFGPLDGGITNVASYGVVVAAGAPAGCIIGDVGVIDATSTVNGLISLPAKRLNPAAAASAVFRPANPTATVSSTLVMMGLGSTCAFTPAGSGKVLVNVTGIWLTATAAAGGTVAGRYGTGTAPVNGAAVSGTRFGSGLADSGLKATSPTAGIPFALTDILVLTPGTAYWFDLTTGTLVPADAATITNVSMTLVELAG